MRRDKFYLILILIAGAVLLNSCFSGSKNQLEESKTERVISSDDGLFSITIPKGWIQLTNYELNDEADIQAQKRLGDQYVIILTDTKEDLAYTFEEWKEEVIENYMSSLENGEISDGVDIEIDGRPAKQYEIRGKIDYIKICLLATYVDGDTYFAQILTWTTASKYKSSIEDFKKITNSIKGLNQTNQNEIDI